MRNPYKDLIFAIKKAKGNETLDIYDFSWSDDLCSFELDPYYISFSSSEYDDEQAINLLVKNINSGELTANLTTLYSEIAFNFIKQLVK